MTKPPKSDTDLYVRLRDLAREMTPEELDARLQALADGTDEWITKLRMQDPRHADKIQDIARWMQGMQRVRSEAEGLFAANILMVQDAVGVGRLAKLGDPIARFTVRAVGAHLKAAHETGQNGKCGTCEHVFTSPHEPGAFMLVRAAVDPKSVVVLGFCDACCGVHGHDGLFRVGLELWRTLYPDVCEITPS